MKKKAQDQINRKKIIKKTADKIKKDKFNLPKIAVIGVGGSGGNATNYMIRKGVKNVKFIAINTDLQDLYQSKATKKIHIGRNITGGNGTGMNPAIGKRAAEESKEEVMKALKDYQLVFLTCGMGGGTGTGAAPIVASIAKDLGILTVAIVTKPFSFEGKKRKEVAESGIEDLSENIDSYIVIENDKILETSDEDASLDEAFTLSDEVLKQAVEGVAELITKPGKINIDYADIKYVLSDSGMSLIGIATAKGEDRAKNAAMAAIHSPLLSISTRGANSILFSVAATGDLKMSEVSEIADIITEEASDDAMIKFGTVRNNNLKKGEIKITIIASKFNGFKKNNSESIKTFNLKMKKNDNLIEPVNQESFNHPKEDIIEESESEKNESYLSDIIASIPVFFKRKKDD